MAELLPFVDVPPRGAHQRTIIWLHGLGDSGHGFAPVTGELALSDELGIRFIFPHAPHRAITINGGMQMPAWYDIQSMALNQRADSQGLAQSSQQVAALIDQEIAQGIASENILLAGFSQGGVVALNVATSYPHKLAGVMGLSTYLADTEAVAKQISAANANIPVMMAHGSMDDVVNIGLGKLARDTLQQAGLSVEWSEYPMGHNLCHEEIAAIKYWLERIFGQ